MAATKRIFTRLAALIALSPAFIGCGSSVPARPTALDPSNPDAPESPPRMSSEQRAAPLAMHANASPNLATGDASAPPTQPDHQHRHPDNRGAPPTAVTATAAPSAAASAPAATVYTCPMHPEVTSDRPGNCPKCGMKLVPKAQAVAPNSAAHAHGAPGGMSPSSGAVSK